MNWFGDLFGSIENPMFRKPLTYHPRMIAYGGQEKYLLENLSEAEWLNRQDTNHQLYVYAKQVSGTSTDHAIVWEHPIDGYPNNIEMASGVHGYMFSIQHIHPTQKHLPSMSFTLYEGSITDVTLTYSSARDDPFRLYYRYEFRFDNINECNAVDILTTSFYKDDITKMAIMSALQDRNEQVVKQLLMGA